MADLAGQGFVLPPGQGRPIDLGSFTMSVKATADQTHGHLSLLEAAEPADFGPPLHLHRDVSESFYVLEGEYAIFVDQRQFACPAGTVIFIPAGTPHSSGSSPRPAESWTCSPPPRWWGTSTSSAGRSMRAGPTPRCCRPSPPTTRRCHWRHGRPHGRPLRSRPCQPQQERPSAIETPHASHNRPTERSRNRKGLAWTTQPPPRRCSSTSTTPPPSTTSPAPRSSTPRTPCWSSPKAES